MPPKRRRRHQGLYYHSSPPKVLSMIGSQSGNFKREDGTKDVFVIKPSNIRIWIHDKDIKKLTKVLWAGEGNRLRSEASTNSRIRRFLENVPFVLNVIKDVHQAVIDNDLDALKMKTKSPVPFNLIKTKDGNGLTVMHKAAGLGYTSIVEYLLSIWPEGATERDATGKTPLHWAVSAKNNTRIYNLLVQAGAAEDSLDNRMKTALDYKQKSSDLDRSLLYVLPDAPRVPLDSRPDWSLLSDEEYGSSSTANTIKSSTSYQNSNEIRRGSDVIGNEMNLLKTRSRANSIDKTLESKQMEEGNGNINNTDDKNQMQNIINNNNAINDDTDIGFKSPTSPPIMNANQNNNINDENDQSTAFNNNRNSFEEDNDDDDDDESSEKQQSNLNLNENAENSNINGDDNDDDGNNEIDDGGSRNDYGNIEENDGEMQNGSGEMEIQENDEENINENDKGQDEQVKIQSIEQDEEGNELSEIKNTENEKIEIDNADDNKMEGIEENGKEMVNENNNDNEDDIDVDDDNEKLIAENSNQNDEEENIDKTEISNKENVQDDMNLDIEQTENITNNHDDKNEEIENENKNKLNSDDEKLSTEEPPTNDDENLSNDNKTEIENDENDKESDDMNNVDTNNNNDDVKNNLIKNGIQKISSKDEVIKKLDISSADEKNRNKNDGDKEEEEDDDDDQKMINKKNKTTDENRNELRIIDNSKELPSQPLELQGFVHEEPDDNQVQSPSEGFEEVNEETRIKQTIDSGDMEQLASLVLNGEGKKLLNRTSSQPEIQAFLDNVQNYMDKIRRVHLAARDGNLRNLQTALDRRKFAVAKDEISPDSASPLHVATIFGHSAIIRYLGGRFPETTTTVDDNGRTALHYAATINDNGHFYNLLTHLGANPKTTDKFGYTAEFYRNQEEAGSILSYKQLLKRFGANENLEDEMLSDQGEQDRVGNNPHLEIPLFRTEQGQYLASTLGDPLIKGLTEVADKQPKDPVAYLANFLLNFNKSKSNKAKKQKQVEQREIDTPASLNTNSSSNTPSNRRAKMHRDSTTSEKNENADKDESPSTAEAIDSALPIEDRDEHGQSMLHFACARSHGRNALYSLIDDSQINITYRDELYRTARDVSIQASQPANTKEIDKYVLTLAARGELKAFENMVIEGYDHILDIVDDEGNTVIDIARSRGHHELTKFLEEIEHFEESREELHQAIREKDFDKVQEMTALVDSFRLIRAKNYYGRTAVHIAVLKENEEIVEYLANICPAALRIGDNIERTPLHYAMGVNSVETLSRILIKKGAKRTVKDLKGRQPSYYFMNKSDISRLQEEEKEDR